MYHLQIVTPEKVFFDGQVKALIAPGEEGYFGILTNHAPMLAALKQGVLIITDEHNKKFYYDISLGFLEVNHNQCSIIIDAITPRAPVDIGVQGGI